MLWFKMSWINLQLNKKRLKRVICRYILLFLLFLGYYLLNKLTGFCIFCPINHFTGYLCPGCGVTRCLFSILELHFEKAFYYNQLVFILLPFFSFYCLYNTVDFVFEKNNPIRIPNYVMIPLLIIVIAFGVVRNII